MGEIVGFIRKDDEEPSRLQSTVFDFAIVPDKYYVDSGGVCPHCGTTSQPELIEMIGDSYTTTIGDLMNCVDCTGVYVVVEHPVINLDKPVMTRWAVPEKIYKKN